MKIEFESEIKRFLGTETVYDSLYPTKSFEKSRIMVEFENNDVIVEFIDKKIELLKYCKSGQSIKFYVKLKVRSWQKDNRTFYANELICYDLKILKTLNYSKEYIEYKGVKYVLKKNSSEDILTIGIFNIATFEYIDLSHKHKFEDPKYNKTYILYKEELGTELLELLYHKKILNKGFFISDKNGMSGYVCEVLVLHFFNSNQYLPIKYQGSLHTHTKFSCYYTEHQSSEYDEIDYTNFNDDLDMDGQSEEFWNQF